MNLILDLDYTVLLILSSLIIAVLLGWISIRLAPEIGLMDIPGSAGHKAHSNPIPLTGGVVLIDAILFMSLITGLWKDTEILAIVISGLIIASFGLIDDFMDLSPIKKLIGQISGSIVLIYLGVQIQIFDSPEFFYRTDSELAYWLNISFTILWLITITNAFNFIDSIDGLATGLSGMSIAFFLFISILSGQVQMIYFCSILLGICIGIYFFNAHPAKLFLGDSGAQTFGFLLASIAIVFDPNTGNQSSTWFVPILFFSVPLFDLTLVIISRFRRKKNIYMASRDHTFHRLEKMGISIQHAVLTMHGVSLIMSMVGYLCLNLPSVFANIVFLQTLLLAIFMIIKLDNNYS
ncbi:MAG: hypothetical protein CMG55_10240 [Candidatus Marinimicrobia bacterium]|nr:hypothetical protein [Candidatus Neomarinimicrobiota bacterium]|tara:strand:- start:3293 stop:4342 length:1050 start_codon:yes stop_codon:yes gene_type:complete